MDIMTPCELSVLIPVYNAEAWLPRVLDCVTAQMTPAIEIVVVDDASEGNCREIVARYQDQGAAVRYIRHDKNRGLLQARLTGIKEARGRFVLPLDADDLLSRNACAELLRLIADTDVDMAQY